MYVTAAYGAILGLLFVFLSFRIIFLRRKTEVGIGDGDLPVLQRASRVHSNFAEYVPISLLLIGCVEAHSPTPIMAHVLSCALLLGRLVHAFGVSQVNENYRYRIFGMVCTLTVIIVASILILVHAIRTQIA